MERPQIHTYCKAFRGIGRTYKIKYALIKIQEAFRDTIRHELKVKLSGRGVAVAGMPPGAIKLQSASTNFNDKVQNNFQISCKPEIKLSGRVPFNGVSVNQFFPSASRLDFNHTDSKSHEKMSKMRYSTVREINKKKKKVMTFQFCRCSSNILTAHLTWRVMTRRCDLIERNNFVWKSRTHAKLTIALVNWAEGSPTTYLLFPL